MKERITTTIIVLLSISFGLGLGYFIYPEKITKTVTVEKRVEVKVPYEPEKSVSDIAVEACVKNSGVPKKSVWDGQIVCKYK